MNFKVKVIYETKGTNGNKQKYIKKYYYRKAK